MERVLDILTGAIVASALFYTVDAYSCEVSTMEAVHVAYKANDMVQKAVDIDVCHRVGTKPTLSAFDKVTYLIVQDALEDAYRESAGTDSAVEQVQRDFCEAMGER